MGQVTTHVASGLTLISRQKALSARHLSVIQLDAPIMGNGESLHWHKSMLLRPYHDLSSLLEQKLTKGHIFVCLFTILALAFWVMPDRGSFPNIC